MGETDSRRVTLTCSRRKLYFRDRHFGAVLQLLKAAVSNNVSGMDPLNRDHAGIGDSSLHIRHLRLTILDDINKSDIAVVLYRGIRNQNLVRKRLYCQPGIHELVGKQSLILVIKRGA